MRYFVLAYDVPMKLKHPLEGHRFIHEEELGYYKTLKGALKKCELFCKGANHALYLCYVTEYDDAGKQVVHKPYDEWIESTS